MSAVWAGSRHWYQPCKADFIRTQKARVVWLEGFLPTFQKQAWEANQCTSWEASDWSCEWNQKCSKDFRKVEVAATCNIYWGMLPSQTEAIWAATDNAEGPGTATSSELTSPHNLLWVLDMELQDSMLSWLGFSFTLVLFFSIPLFLSFRIGMFTLSQCMLEVCKFLFDIRGSKLRIFLKSQRKLYLDILAMLELLTLMTLRDGLNIFYITFFCPWDKILLFVSKIFTYILMCGRTLLHISRFIHWWA